jgi:adenylate cyclase
VGGYLPVTDATAEYARLLAAAGVAALALLGALAVAVWLGRRFSRPAGELALASERIARLELDAVPELRRSHLAELDAAARAFNGMVGALRLFVRYAPAKLVRALLDRGEEAARSERRVVTVMFTDIAGFTAAAERMTAEAAAGLLNAHMTLVVGCV